MTHPPSSTAAPRAADKAAPLAEPVALALAARRLAPGRVLRPALRSVPGQALGQGRVRRAEVLGARRVAAHPVAGRLQAAVPPAVGHPRVAVPLAAERLRAAEHQQAAVGRLAIRWFLRTPARCSARATWQARRVRPIRAQAPAISKTP